MRPNSLEAYNRRADIAAVAQYTDQAAKYLARLKSSVLSLALESRHPEYFQHAYHAQLPLDEKSRSLRGDELAAARKARLDAKQLPAVIAAINGIHKDGLNPLKRLLGPVSPRYHDYSRTSKSNYWRWIKAQCQLYLIHTREVILFSFTKDNVISLTPQQENQYKATVIKQLREDFEAFVDTLQLDSVIKLNVEQILGGLIEELQESVICPYHHIAKDLYKLSEIRKKFEAVSETCEQVQLKNNAHYFDVDGIWREFEKEVGQDCIQALQKSGIASRSLEDCCFDEEHQETLVDHVIHTYSKGDEITKRDLLLVIEYLLLHGNKPTDKYRQAIKDLPVLSLIVRYLDTPTESAEQLRVQLANFCQTSQNIMSSSFVDWMPRFIFNIQTMHAQCQIAAGWVAMMGSKEVAVQQQLFATISDEKAVATTTWRGLWNFDLKAAVHMRVAYEWQHRQLLAAPVSTTAQTVVVVGDGPSTNDIPLEDLRTPLVTRVVGYGATSYGATSS